MPEQIMRKIVLVANEGSPTDVVRTQAAANIIDIMMGGKTAWRDRLADSDFLESADWATALQYADAALTALRAVQTAPDALVEELEAAATKEARIHADDNLAPFTLYGMAAAALRSQRNEAVELVAWMREKAFSFRTPNAGIASDAAYRAWRDAADELECRALATKEPSNGRQEDR